MEHEEINLEEPLSSATKTASSFDRDAWMAQKKQDREDAFHIVEQTLERILAEPGLMQTFLDVLARMDRYSVSNLLLITAQQPNASRLLDSKGWREQKAFIKKGERGMLLLEPGDEYTRKDGSTGVNFNAKRVFDLSQTDYKAVPVPSVKLDTRLLLRALLADRPCAVVYGENLPDGIYAQYKPDEKTVVVRKELPPELMFRCLAQEFAHARLNTTEDSRNANAFAAYCTTYILCKRYGQETDIFNFAAIPKSISEMNPKDLKKELGRIRTTANDLTLSMEKTISRQHTERKWEAPAR